MLLVYRDLTRVMGLLARLDHLQASLTVSWKDRARRLDGWQFSFFKKWEPPAHFLHRLHLTLAEHLLIFTYRSQTWTRRMMFGTGVLNQLVAGQFASAYPGHLQMLTDGSVHPANGTVTVAFTIPALDMCSSGRMNITTSSATTGLLAPQQSFQKLLLLPFIGSAVIITDSSGALRQLQRPDSPDPFVRELVNLYHFV